MAITNALGLELPQGDDNLENGLIDTKMLQELQDQFCYSNNLYVVCLGQKEGVITKAYGSKEELEYVHSLVNESVYMQLVSKIENEQPHRIMCKYVQFLHESKEKHRLSG